MTIIKGIPDEQVQRAVRRIIYNSADNEERELQLTQMLRDIDVNNGFNKASAWQTIEEFKANPVDGWCHIMYDHSTEVAYYNEGRFFFKDNSVVDSDDTWNIDHISSVQPILTPEAPE